MSFSPSWLALREPVDHASRNADVAMEVAAHFAGRDHVSVVDLGCGTGSNLRATALLLPAQQSWLLVDYDPALLAAARDALRHWADTVTEDGDALVLAKAGRSVTVRFRQADLAAGAQAVIGGKPDLVTASALFDLIAAGWIDSFAREVARVGAAFYTVLTYNGVDQFNPPHPLDGAVIDAFAAHQAGDKGFGLAAGPAAPAALTRAFSAAGYRVQEGDSPWRIGTRQQALAAELLPGIANAVTETGRIAPEALARWLDFRLDAARSGGQIVTGHTDTFATPA